VAGDGRGQSRVVRDLSAKDTPIIATLEGHKDVVQSLAWNADGTLLAAGGYRSVLVWKSADWKVAHTLTAPLEGRVTGMTFLADKTTLMLADGATARKACCIAGSSVRRSPRRRIEAHADNILSLAISRDGKQIATGGADNRRRCGTRPRSRRSPRSKAMWAMSWRSAFSTDGKWLATGRRTRI
jgi:WD40 repeat protein